MTSNETIAEYIVSRLGVELSGKSIREDSTSNHQLVGVISMALQMAPVWIRNSGTLA